MNSKEKGLEKWMKSIDINLLVLVVLLVLPIDRKRKTNRFRNKNIENRLIRNLLVLLVLAILNQNELEK